jgi:carbon-monoxide dehydrogenase small subunit
VLGDARVPNVEEAELRRAVAGVLCRCTGYQRMIEALRQVASGGG